MSRRDELIEDLRYGRIKPEQAEEEAARLGLEPFAIDPKAAFDPLHEPWWSLPMVVAWIAWRSSDRVRDNWKAYRSECWDFYWRPWRVGFDGPEHEGYFLEQRRSATLARMGISEAIARAEGNLPPSALSIQDAVAKLWRALTDGLLEATGIEESTKRRTTIAKTQWRDLKPVETRGKDVLCYSCQTQMQEQAFEEIEFPRASIIDLWPVMRSGLADVPLPPQIPPTGPGYMPLYCAAQWIATEGGKKDVDPTIRGYWAPVYAELLNRIASEEIKVLGVRNGQSEPIPAHTFASLRVDYPFTDATLDLILEEDLHLCSYAYTDEKSWRDGLDDSLRDRTGLIWKRIVVHKPDVLKHWSFTAEPPQESGAPGRPTSMHLVEAEFRARCERGDVERSLRKEAKALSGWLSVTHPASPQLTAKTIENNLREEYRTRRDRQPRN